MATVVRWEPLRELAALQNEVSRYWNQALGDTGSDQARGWVPAADVWETEKEIVYAFDLPGIPEDDISLEFEDGALTVSGERSREGTQESDRFYRFERRFGAFSRTISLPQGIDEKAIGADYANGVLEVRVRKPEAPKPRRIQVGSGSKATIEGKAKKA